MTFPLGGGRGETRHGRDLLMKALMGAGVVEVLYIGFHDTSEVLFAQQQTMVQTLAAHISDEALNNGIRTRRKVGVRKTWMSTRAATRSKTVPYLLSLSRIRYLGPLPKAVASRSCCATH
jgi:hypothetical protein